MFKAIIFDIDGTLIDSVDLHAMAWHEALHEFGFHADYEAVRAQIGKGGDKLVPEFVPKDRVDAIYEKLSGYRGDLFKRKYLPLIRPLSCVPELMQRITDDGLRIALASSAKEDELQAYVKLAGIEKFIHEQTSKDEVGESKPAPDIFATALSKLKGIKPDEALAIGDTPYDAISARQAGLQVIGVLTGGWTREELRQSGCFAVYRSVAELFATYDQSALTTHRRAA